MYPGRVLWIGLLLGVALLAAGACGAAPAPAPATAEPTRAPADTPTSAPTAAPQPAGFTTVRIGVVDDLSGPVAEAGTDNFNSFELRINQANAEGGVHGRQIEIVVYDSQADPEKSTTFLRRLIDEDKVHVVMGGSPSQAVAADIPTAQEARVPYVIPVAATEAFTDPVQSYIFRTGLRNQDDATAIAQYIADHGFERPGIINHTLPFGFDGGNVVEATLKDLGITPVAHEVYETQAPDVTPQVLNLRDANPDVVVVWPFPADGALVVKTMRQIGFQVPTLIARIGLFDTFRQSIGEAGEGILVPNSLDLDRSDVQEFLETREAAYGERPPTMYVGEGYDAAQVFLAALGAPEVGDALDSGDLQAVRDAIRDALEGVDIAAIQGHEGAQHRFSADDHDSPEGDFHVWYRIENTELVPAAE